MKCFANIALCCLKLGRPEDAAGACRSALALPSANNDAAPPYNGLYSSLP